MKALSIKQPWAYLIANGIKDVENRTWQTKYRGWVLIHASAKSDKHFCLSEQRRLITKSKLTSFAEFLNSTNESCIIGVMYIDSIDKEMKSIWDDSSCYHWRISKVIKFNEPIRNIKGKLNLWNYYMPNEIKQIYLY